MNNGIHKAINIPQAELRQSRDHSTEEHLLPFVSTFNPNSPSVFPVIKAVFSTPCENEVPGMENHNTSFKEQKTTCKL